jgi:hypothetical protein
MKALSVSIILLLAALVAANAQTKPSIPVYLCKGHVTANQFWEDMYQANKLNIQLSLEVMRSIAEKHQCELVQSQTLRPKRFFSSSYLMQDGKFSGWMHAEYYIYYANTL